MKFVVALVLVIVSIMLKSFTCSSLTCIRSLSLDESLDPRIFTSLERSPSDLALKRSSNCQQELLTSDLIAAWNSNLKVLTEFHKLHRCVTIKDRWYTEQNKTCLFAVEKHFSKLRNKPLCCQINASWEFSGCFVSSNAMCKNDVIATSSIFTQELCNGQLYKYSECNANSEINEKASSESCKDLNLKILSLNYLTFGCIDRRHLPGIGSADQSKDNTAAAQLIVDSFCHMTAAKRNCCRSSNLCNLESAMALIANQDGNRSFPMDFIGFGPRAMASLKPGESTLFLPWLAAAGVGGFAGLAALSAVAAAVVLACRKLSDRAKLSRLLNRLGLRSARAVAVVDNSVQEQNLLMQRLHEGEAVAEAGEQTRSPGGRRQQQRRRSRGGYSSSGYGNPSLVQRTIARDTTVAGSVGQGRFGQVFKGVWRTGDVSDIVAIKIFHSRAEASWSREGEIYATPGLAHPAILGFIAMDNLDAGWETQLWLITDYHANGSLQAYLTQHEVDWRVAAGMCHSIVSGLSHLHTDLVSAGFTKPGIAHCDIKSNNILVKADLTCCLADFGLAVKETDEISRDSERRVGTIRYLSPELLDGSVVPNSFEALKQADLYALGLVLWEIGHRCLGQPANAYSLPYADTVPSNPSPALPLGFHFK